MYDEPFTGLDPISLGAISNLIREGKTFQIPSMMQVGKALGMQTLNDALAVDFTLEVGGDGKVLQHRAEFIAYLLVERGEQFFADDHAASMCACKRQGNSALRGARRLRVES